MKRVLQFISLIGLLLTIVPPILLFNEMITYSIQNMLMFIGTILWFVSAWFWLGSEWKTVK